MSSSHVSASEHSAQATAKPTSAATRVQLHHVLLLGTLTTLGPLATDLYLPALPSVSQDLNAGMSLTQLTLTVCILGLALGQVFTGPLSDARGRRGPLLIGSAVFTLATLLCSRAPSVGILTALRFVQGLAGATGIVLALAIARDLYSGTALARCIALLMTVNFLAPIAAPVLGGQLLSWLPWRGVFVVLALISMLLPLAYVLSLGETLPPAQRQRGGIAALGVTFRALLNEQQFVGYALASGFAFTAGIVYISVAPFILQHLYGLSPQRFSLVFGINALGLAGMSQLSARLLERTTPRRLLLAGASSMALAGVALLAVVWGGLGLPGMLPALFVIVASLGLIAPNATALALATSTPQTAGSASALLGVVQLAIGAVFAPLLGLAGNGSAVPMALAIAVFGLLTLGTTVFTGRKAE